MNEHYLNNLAIDKGLKKGVLFYSGTQIKNKENGQIVKVVNKVEADNIYIPHTLIQVNNNYTYKADLKPIIDIIVNNRENDVYEELKEIYFLIMDYFDSYKSYSTGLEKLYEMCLEASVKFDLRLKNEMGKLSIENIESKNLFGLKSSLSAYVDILFSYIISTYALQGPKFSNDTIILDKLSSFEKNVKNLYEQLLAKSTSNREADGRQKNNISMKDSIYSMYIFSDDYNIYNIERLIHHDSRLSSVSEVLNLYKTSFKEGCFLNANSNNSYLNYNNKVEEIKISVSTSKIDINSNRNTLIEKLYLILEYIENLKNIRRELVELKGVVTIDLLDDLSI